jgi:predicted hydrocarbon binding protein
MLDAIDLPTHQMLVLPRASLAALRGTLVRDAGPSAASDLQEAGYAGGDAVFASFGDWLRAREEQTPPATPERLELTAFQRLASTYFQAAGWGSLEISTLHDLVAILDSPDWGEADPENASDHPGCHITTGIFADFFGRLAGHPLAVLEVECRSAGDPRCRFLIGNADVMNGLYDRMANGASYEAAAAAMTDSA